MIKIVSTISYAILPFEVFSTCLHLKVVKLNPLQRADIFSIGVHNGKGSREHMTAYTVEYSMEVTFKIKNENAM